MPTVEPCHRLCLVEDDEIMGESLLRLLRLEGFAVDWCRTAAEALEAVDAHRHSVIVSDIRLPDRDGGDLFLEMRKRHGALPPVLFMTAYGTIDRAVELLKAGAADYVTKPFDVDVLVQKVRALAENYGAIADGGDAALGVSPAMRRIAESLPRLARHAAALLITGESGAGKEHVARLFHQHAAGAAGEFVAVNCAAIPEPLMEAELFGYERGAFTGALMRKLGKFELANHGTLLLDEISEMNLPLQAKLLRVLQEREVDRVGGTGPVPVNIRVIATTNKPLYREVAAGRFREDLYYRLNVFPITLPPLRERRADIALLARAFAQSAAARNAVPVSPLSERALAYLEGRMWKGNVRELENAVERAVLVAGGETIEPQHFPPDAQATTLGLAANASIGTSTGTSVEPGASTSAGDGGNSLWEMERDLIVKTLVRVAQNRTKAAKELGISVRTLRNKLREYRQGAEGTLLGDDIDGEKIA